MLKSSRGKTYHCFYTRLLIDWLVISLEHVEELEGKDSCFYTTQLDVLPFTYWMNFVILLRPVSEVAYSDECTYEEISFKAFLGFFCASVQY